MLAKKLFFFQAFEFFVTASMKVLLTAAQLAPVKYICSKLTSYQQ